MSTEPFLDRLRALVDDLRAHATRAQAITMERYSFALEAKPAREGTARRVRVSMTLEHPSEEQAVEEDEVVFLLWPERIEGLSFRRSFLGDEEPPFERDSVSEERLLRRIDRFFADRLQATPGYI